MSGCFNPFTAYTGRGSGITWQTQLYKPLSILDPTLRTLNTDVELIEYVVNCMQGEVLIFGPKGQNEIQRVCCNLWQLTYG